MEREPVEEIRQDTRTAIGATRKDRIYCLKVSSDYHSEVCEECRFYPNCDHMTQDDMTELTIKDLETLEQQDMLPITPIQKWTPVSEELPKEPIYKDFVEPSEPVLVQLNNGEMKVSRYWGSRESRKNEPWIDLSYPTTLEVVAWMPLPKSYK